MEKRILLDTSVYGKLAEEEYLFLLLLEKKKEIDFVSNDKRTQFSEAALKAYKEVNFKQGFKNPIYLLYDSFKEKILRRSGI